MLSELNLIPYQEGEPSDYTVQEPFYRKERERLWAAIMSP
jgi:hypothetical protein